MFNPFVRTRTDAAAPDRPRSRRRWIAGVLILFVLTGVAWRFTPRIDPRLVGRWVNVDDDSWPPARQFAANGTSTHIQMVSVVAYSNYCRWSVSGDMLILKEDGLFGVRTTGFEKLRQQTRDIWRLLCGDPNADRYRILEITPTTLRIQEIGTNSGWEVPPVETYRRENVAP
jgi:hypothetical protein